MSLLENGLAKLYGDFGTWIQRSRSGVGRVERPYRGKHVETGRSLNPKP